MSDKNPQIGLQPYLTPLEVWALSIGCLRGGKLIPYTLQAIKTRSSDDHHIVIGIRPE